MPQNYYCKYCGTKNSSISALTSNACSMNPSKGKHALYEGSEKAQYSCKLCGTKNSSMSALVHNHCSRNSNGKYHEVSL